MRFRFTICTALLIMTLLCLVMHCYTDHIRSVQKYNIVTTELRGILDREALLLQKAKAYLYMQRYKSISTRNAYSDLGGTLYSAVNISVDLVVELHKEIDTLQRTEIK